MKKYLSFLIIIGFCACTNQNVSEIENENILLIEQYFKHFNAHHWDKMANMYIEEAEFKDPSFGQEIIKQKREEIVKKYSELNEIFPDLHDEVIQIYPSGENHVIVEFVSSGTAPDGSKFELPICTIFTLDNGKITKDFTYFDNFDEENQD